MPRQVVTSCSRNSITLNRRRKRFIQFSFYLFGRWIATAVPKILRSPAAAEQSRLAAARFDMATASSQHRCVFVGNIPYDATEEQLIQICEEVGPVVSFRLVLDRETGKPKGYGFCEYKDEETALSARRNLQGYEINGRQLRVDFAENDKGADRNREQGRGGPGLISNVDAQRPLPGPPILGDSALHQPMGLPLAATAASVMARTLGGAQSTSLQSLSGLGNDALTHYLAKMSRHQLNEIMTQMKALATQNKLLARQLLQGCSQLPKVLFQVQIMLGLVTPQMMQMASNRQSSSSVLQPSLKDNTQDQKPVLPSYLGQTPLQKETMVASYSRPPESQVSNVLPNSLILQQSEPPLQHGPVQPQFQHPSPPQHQVHPQGMMLGKSGVPTIPSLQHQPLSGLSIQPQTPPLPASKGLISQIQPPLLQHPRPIGGANTTHHPHLKFPSTILQQPLLPHRSTSQTGSLNHPVLPGLETLSKEVGLSASANHDLTCSSRSSTHPNSGVGLVEQTGMGGDMSELINHPSKRTRLEDGSGAPQGMSSSSVSGQSIASGSLCGSQVATADWMQQSEKQMPQLPLDVESALLQQVMSLTPEQLRSLPLEQQQQVLQLQQMLR